MPHLIQPGAGEHSTHRSTASLRDQADNQPNESMECRGGKARPEHGQQTGQRARCGGAGKHRQITLTRTVNERSMLSSSPAKIHEPLVTGVSPRPTDQRGARKLRNTRVTDGVDEVVTYFFCGTAQSRFRHHRPDRPAAHPRHRRRMGRRVRRGHGPRAATAGVRRPPPRMPPHRPRGADVHDQRRSVRSGRVAVAASGRRGRQRRRRAARRRTVHRDHHRGYPLTRGRGRSR